MHDRHHIITRRTFLTIQALALAELLPGCSAGAHDEDSSASQATGHNRTWDEIRSSGYINIGTCSDNIPFGFINAQGTYAGFDEYFCLYFADKTSLRIHHVSLDPKDRYANLFAGDVDFCMVQMSPLDALSRDAEYTSALYSLQLGIVSPADTTIESIDHLQQGELIVCAGTYAEQYAIEHWPDAALRPYATLSETYDALGAGMGIALIADEISESYWLKNHPDYCLSMRNIGEPRMIAPAVAQGQDELLARLDEIAIEYCVAGYAKTAYERYIGPNTSEDYSPLFVM